MNITTAVDIWAMVNSNSKKIVFLTFFLLKKGCILFGMVFGKLPFNGNTPKDIQ